MYEIEELYDRLLNYRGATMWETVSNQFPEDEVIYLWNRSMTSQSIERAWHLNPVSERVDNSIPNFKVTHHRMVRDGDRLIPTIDTEVWTNDQLRDALGYDWMYDQNLTLEDNWMDTGRNVDHHIVSRIATFADEVAAILPVESDYQGGFLIRTDSDHVFLEPRKNLLERMGDPNHVDGVEPTLPLREDSDSQPVNPSVERCLYNGSTLRDFSLVRDNLLRSLDMREFSDWEYKPRENSSLFHNTSGLQGAYMLNLFFHQNRLDGLYSWYQDIYLSNVRYLREYLRSVNLNSDYQVNDDGLTLSDEWQLYLRNSNIFVDAYVRNFGRLSYPFVELNDPNATSNDLNNLKLLRLSLMSDMDYLCFLTQSHFLRSLVDPEFESEPNLLSCVSERSVLFNNSESIVTGIQVNNMTFNGLNTLSLHPEFLKIIQGYNSMPSLKIKEFLKEYFLLEEGTFLKEEKGLKSRIILPKLYQLIWEQERSQTFRFWLNCYSVFNNPILSSGLAEERTSIANNRLASSKNFWLDYLTLTRFLQDDPSYQDQLDWTGWVDSHFSEHVITLQEQLDRLMFNDTDCQVHPQPELDRIPESDRQNLLDQWYLSSENRKVSPNLHNRELRSLLPVFLMSQVLGGDELNMDFLPTNEQLNDPVRFVSSLELANSFFDDYNSRKTWSDEDIDMLERVLTEYDQLNSLSEELSEEFFHYVRQGNCDGITDLLLLLDLTVKTWLEDKSRDNIYLKLKDYGVSTLSLRREILNSFCKKIEYNDKKSLGTLRNLRMIEQHIQDKSIQVRQLTQTKASFLRQSEHREIDNVVDLKLLYLDDSVIRNIFVRNNMLNKLIRLGSKDELSLSLSTLNVDRDREVIDRIISEFVRGQRELESWELASEINYWLVNNKNFLRLSYLGWLLKNGVNLKVTEDPADFSRRLRMFSRLLSSNSKLQRLPRIMSNEFIELMEEKHTTLMSNEYIDYVVKVRVWDASVRDWVNPQVNFRKVGALLSRREYLRLLIGKNLHGVELPIGVFNYLIEEPHDQQENKHDENEDQPELHGQLDDSFLTSVTLLDDSDHSTGDIVLNLSLTL